MRRKLLIGGLIVLLLGTLAIGVEDTSVSIQKQYLSFTPAETVETLIAYAMARGFELPDTAQWIIECAVHAPYPCTDGMWVYGHEEIDDLRLRYKIVQTDTYTLDGGG